MAAQYDEMGNYLGDYETEEERKKREQLANTAVHTTEVKTYGDGTQEKITKEEIPGAVQPRTMPTAAGPIAPTDPVFQRQLQAESGNRQTDPRTGQIMTSPKGALGIAQIMPATAMQPGYGVPDIFTLAQQRGMEVPDRSEATAKQLLGNQALNQEFGQNYKNAMLQRFGGDQAAATAAYNAGPGRVGQNMANNAGQMNTAQLPQETQGYLGKVMSGLGNVVNAVIPSAQASTLPPGQAQRPATITPGAMPAVAQQPTPVAPSAMPTQQDIPRMTIDDAGNKTIMNPDGTTVLLGPDNRPLAAGGMEPRDTPQFRNRLFEEAGKDPLKWMEIAKSPDYAQIPALQTVAKQQARALFEQEFKMDGAKEQTTKLVAAAGAGDAKAGRAIADELKKQEGSYVKMILLGFLSPQLAGEEAVKLGFGNKWTSVTNDKGESALIQVNAKGLPLKGITADNKELSQEQLAGFAAGIGRKDYDIVGGTFVSDTMKDKDGNPMVGSLYRSKTNPNDQFVQTAEGRKPLSGFRPQTSSGSLADMRARKIQEINLELQGKTEEEKMAILRDRNKLLIGAGYPPIDPSEVGIRAPQIAGGAAPAAAVQGGPAVPGTPAVTGAVPVPQGGGQVSKPAVPVPLNQAPQGTQRPSNAELEGRTTVVTKANEVIAGASGFMDKIDIVNEGITATTKKNNLGTIAEGVLPGERFVGKYIMGSADQRNTDKAINAVKTVAAEGLKALGSQPTDADRDYLTANIPDETWNDKDVRDWLISRRDFIKRKVDIAKKQISSGGSYVPEMPADVPTTAPQTPADKARAELERRKKEKKN